jgi:membrane protein DedA with SNARE-associated domain
VLASNRFVPALRAFFFVGAGLSDMPLRAVVLWGGLSAAVWNGILLAVGYAVGENFDELESIFAGYSQFVLGALLVVLLGAFLWRLRPSRGD